MNLAKADGFITAVLISFYMYSILILSFSFDFKSVSKIKGSGKVPAARKGNTKTRKHENTKTRKRNIYHKSCNLYAVMKIDVRLYRFEFVR